MYVQREHGVLLSGTSNRALTDIGTWVPYHARNTFRRMKTLAERMLDLLAARAMTVFERIRRSSPERLAWIAMGLVLLLYLIVLAIEPNAGR